VIAATHTPSTSAANPSGTASASRNGASQSKQQTTNQEWGAMGVAGTIRGQGSMSGDPGAGFMTGRKAGMLTGTAIKRQTLNATAIEIVLPQRTGVVTAVNGNPLTVTGFDARTYTITVGGDTTYRRADHTAALSDVAVGSLISAEGTLSSDGSTLNALAVTI